MSKKKVCVAVVIVVLLILLVLAGLLWMRDSKMRFVKNIGNGINLGNSLDATNLWEYKPEADELSYETFWGNPLISEGQFQAIYDAGFKSVRVPITWNDHLDATGKISETWMQRVQEVVDMALDVGLYVIIDTHHELWLDLDVEREDEICELYKDVWTQIAIRFIDYDEHLLFEGMNEPRLRGSKHEWDAGTEEMQAFVNRLNAQFVETVRATGGENESRYLLICAYASQHRVEALEALEVSSGNIIVSIHMYLPYRFCQDKEGTATWNVDNANDTAEIAAVFAQIDRLFTGKGIPVMLTEFGCRDKGNLSERIAWISFYTRLSAEYGIPCFWWDNGSDYQLLDREKNTWVYPELVNSLTEP